MKFNLKKFKRDIANEFAWHDINGITEEILTTIAENCIVSDVSLSAEEKIDNIVEKVEQLNTMVYSVKKNIPKSAVWKTDFDENGYDFYYCSNCHFTNYSSIKTKFCPDCGCRMYEE